MIFLLNCSCSSEDRLLEIFIKTYKVDNEMVIIVSDNGIGIAESELKKIFHKYQRVPSSAEWSGIGLYLVKEIMEASGGRIEVSSELGKGSVFSLFLKLTG